MTIRMRIALAVLGMTSVVPLLAWVYDLGPFHVWFWAVSVPGAIALVSIGVIEQRRSPGGPTHQVLSVAVVAGLVGTLCYDLVRVPFIAFGGYRLLSPIESYGVLLVDGRTSSGLSDFAGWAYHFSNGVGFAIAYAAVAAGRHWGWAILWAAILETGTLLTPFASDYNLTGNYDVIAIAYAAHVPYGLVLGLMLMRPRETFEALHRPTDRPARTALGVTVLALLLWLAPWRDHRPDELEAADDVAIVNGRMSPEFVRIRTDDCFVVRNLDSDSHTFQQAVGAPEIAGGASGDVCLTEPGVTRLRVTGEPYDGGFVIVED